MRDLSFILFPCVDLNITKKGGCELHLYDYASRSAFSANTHMEKETMSRSDGIILCFSMKNKWSFWEFEDMESALKSFDRPVVRPVLICSLCCQSTILIFKLPFKIVVRTKCDLGDDPAPDVDFTLDQVKQWTKEKVFLQRNVGQRESRNRRAISRVVTVGFEATNTAPERKNEEKQPIDSANEVYCTLNHRTNRGVNLRQCPDGMITAPS
jgi:hypothetical protein